MKLIQLHDRNTGELIMIDPDCITLMRELPAAPPDRALNLPSLPRRLAISARDGMIVLVRERMEEVLALAGEPV